LVELVKCKLSKTFSKPNFTEKSDISRFLTGFQRAWPDMSSPQPRHVQASPYPLVNLA
jgi:hypothetical protein